MDELYREEEINNILRERAGISENLRSTTIDTSTAILETVKELRNQVVLKSEVRSLTREINKIAKDNYSLGISDLGTQKTLLALQKDQAKLNKKINENKKLQETLSQRINTLQGKEKEAAVDLLLSLEAQTGEILELQKGLRDVEVLSRKIQNNIIGTKLRGISDFLKSIPGLSSFSKPFQEASDNITKAAIEAEKENVALQNIYNNQETLNNDYLEYLDSKYKELGISDALGINQEESEKQGRKIFKLTKDAAFARLKEKKILDKIIEGNKTNVVIQNESLKVLNKFGTTLLSGIVAKSFIELDKAQVDFARQTGMNIAGIDTLNNSLATSADYIKTATELTKQFGFNTAFAFDQVNILQAAELVELTGISAENAANLALYSQTTGTSLDTNLDTIVAQVGQLNIVNKSAVNYTEILNDIGNISKATALTFQGNTVEIAKAAQNARILGLNLQQVDKIAAGLLDIESSIAAEFEAEVITGKQLNLERARFFALTNDLTGLTEELAKNEEIINKFATGNRIEQEAIAGALNMSRDEMADMIFQQRLQLGITDEQARLTAGLSQQDFERLVLQEKLSKSLTKVGDSLATLIYPPIALIAELMPAITVGMMAFAAVKLGGLLAGLGRTLAMMAGIKAIATPGAFLIGLTAAATGLSVLYGLSNSFGNKIAKTGDAIIPAGKGPILSTREGGLIQGTANDDVIMAPGISNIVNAQRERNINTTVTLSQEDIRALAKAMKDGAMEGSKQGTSQAQINLDGGRVSNRLQPSLAVNTRKYSI